MEPAYKEFEHFLKIIHSHKPGNIHHLIKSANNRVIKTIIEIAYNLLKGNIHIISKDIDRLKKDKKSIKRLISKRLPINKKRSILIENPKMLKNILSVVFYKCGE